jgi:RNA polymerase sigma factor (sigma-70 family)
LDMNTITDPLELLRAYAIQHDQAAFRRLMEQYYRFVFGVALRVTGSSTMAEEVCQDVFLLLSQQGRKLLAKEVNLAGWLHRVTWNKAQNVRVREQRGRKRERNFALERAVGAAPAMATTTERIDEALEKLSPAERAILFWHYVDRYSFKEIAARLNISAEAAQKRSIRALRHLAQVMNAPVTEDSATAWAALLPALLLPELKAMAEAPWLDQLMLTLAQGSAKVSLAAKTGAFLATGKGIAAVAALLVIPVYLHQANAVAVVTAQPTAVAAEPVLAASLPVIHEPPAVAPQVVEVIVATVPATDAPTAPAQAAATSPPPNLSAPTVPSAPPVVPPIQNPLPVAKIRVGVVPAVMKFDVTRFNVLPGQKVFLLFSNEKCPLQHNLCILKPGTKDKVAEAALKAVADPSFMQHNCFLDSPDVLFKGTKLVGPGQSDLLEFTTPLEPGDYPYLCTFPGHSMLMHGVMEVRPAK